MVISKSNVSNENVQICFGGLTDTKWRTLDGSTNIYFSTNISHYFETVADSYFFLLDFLWEHVD